MSSSLSIRSNSSKSLNSLSLSLSLSLSISFIVHFRSYHHHHLVVPLSRISLTLSRHFSLSFIASSRSSGLHPISSHSCCMYVRAGRPAFARPYLWVILCLVSADGGMYLPVRQQWCIYTSKWIGKRRLRLHLYFASNFLHVLFF